MIVEVAGIRVRLNVAHATLDEAVQHRYAAFRAEGEPDLVWDVQVRDREHSIAAEPVVEHGGGLRYALRYGAVEADLDLAARAGVLRVPDNVLYVDAAFRITLTLLLLERGGLLMHACGFVRGGRGFVLFGPSGAGKTTVSRMVPPEQVLSDEVVAITLGDSGVTAHGTPFYGDLGISNPGSAPAATLARLHHGDDRLENLSPASATSAILNSTMFFCHSPHVTERVIDVASRVALHGVRSLTFRKETHVPSWIDTAVAAA